jgi:hypothetical protein
MAVLTPREIKLRLQREVLREIAGVWKTEDHPELADGAAAWVREIRALDARRTPHLAADSAAPAQGEIGPVAST